jgi:DMSO reductase family type II enzyme heme b subunit
MLSLVLSVSLAAAASPAVDNFLDSEVVEATFSATALPRFASDARWRSVPAKTFEATPQRSVRLNDRRANALITSRAPSAIAVQALYNEEQLAIRMQWQDSTESRVNGNTAAFGDTAAIEFPQTFGRGVRLPYIGMGDAQQNVTVYLWRAITDGSKGREYVGAGFGSLTRSHRRGLNGELRYDEATRTWTALFVRPLKLGSQSLKAGLVPVAFAVWDGERNERGGNKALTSWKFLRLGKFKSDPAYEAEMAWGFGPDDLGDVTLGKTLVESMCVACHFIGDKQLAAPEIAPDLSGIGGISTYTYLRDSILSPSAVVVPHLNINRHYDKAGERDPHGAYPNSAGHAFGAGPPEGKVSKMPPFPLPDPQVGAMVAFLKTLKHEPAAEPKAASKETP